MKRPLAILGLSAPILCALSLCGCSPKGAEPTQADAKADQQKVNDSMRQAYSNGRPGMGAPGATGSTAGGAMPAPPQGAYGRPPGAPR